MISAKVQSVEVEPLGISFGTLSNFPTHSSEHVADVVNKSRDRVRSTLRRSNNRQRNVGGFRCESGLKLSLGKFLLASL